MDAIDCLVRLQTAQWALIQALEHAKPDEVLTAHVAHALSGVGLAIETCHRRVESGNVTLPLIVVA
jgi:hypothetical protein